MSPTNKPLGAPAAIALLYFIDECLGELLEGMLGGERIFAVWTDRHEDAETLLRATWFDLVFLDPMWVPASRLGTLLASPTQLASPAIVALDYGLVSIPFFCGSNSPCSIQPTATGGCR